MRPGAVDKMNDLAVHFREKRASIIGGGNVTSCLGNAAYLLLIIPAR